jgi:hypothetical protein
MQFYLTDRIGLKQAGRPKGLLPRTNVNEAKFSPDV